MTDSVLTSAQQRKLNLRVKRRRLAFAKLSPFGNEERLTLPDPPELDGDLAPSLSPWQEEMIEALSVAWYEEQPKNEKTRRLSKKYPLIPTRAARKKSQEDRTPQLRLHATEEEEDGAGNIIRFDPFDAAAYSAWWDEVHEHGALTDSIVYSEADYRAIAKSWRWKRLATNDGHVRIGGDAHCELIDVDLRIAVGDDFARRLTRDMGIQPFARTRKAEAKLLGISPRTWHRRRSAIAEEQAA